MPNRAQRTVETYPVISLNALLESILVLNESIGVEVFRVFEKVMIHEYSPIDRIPLIISLSLHSSSNAD